MLHPIILYSKTVPHEWSGFWSCEQFAVESSCGIEAWKVLFVQLDTQDTYSLLLCRRFGSLHSAI